jgi:hypothetical protein
LTKTIKSTLVWVILAIVFALIIASQQYGIIFAMHDSTLDVNTWFANINNTQDSSNSTQLHTIDLNNGPLSPTATGEGGEAEQDEVVEEEDEEEAEESPSDENEDNEDEEEEEDQ